MNTHESLPACEHSEKQRMHARGHEYSYHWASACSRVHVERARIHPTFTKSCLQRLSQRSNVHLVTKTPGSNSCKCCVAVLKGREEFPQRAARPPCWIQPACVQAATKTTCVNAIRPHTYAYKRARYNNLQRAVLVDHVSAGASICKRHGLKLVSIVNVLGGFESFA